MGDDAALVSKLLRQQAAIASFGSFSLRESDLLKVLTEAARACAAGLGVPFSKVCRYREAENDLLVEAGYGWKPGVIGDVVSRADETSPQGRAFITGEPSICNDLRLDQHFVLPAFYKEHGIISTVDVIVKGNGHPYGVLEIDNNQQHDYGEQDIIFLTGFANVLAEAVATSARTSLLEATIQQMTALADAQTRLLDQKNVLAEELQHRVRNNLQLVYGMLSNQLHHTVDPDAGRGIRAIARRVATLAQVYDHLLGNELTRTTDFGSYVNSLCQNLAELHASPQGQITLTCEVETIVLDLDTVTALGIVVTELVTNCYDHAFPAGQGVVAVSVHRQADAEECGVLLIRDTGAGFTPSAGSKRHGVGLVRRLVEQVRGHAEISIDHGALWTISFPIPSAQTDPVHGLGRTG